MNKTTKRSLLKLAMALTVTGFFSVAQAVDNIRVQVSLNADQTQLDAISKGKCQKKNHRGCVRVKQDRTANINISLKGDKKCNRSTGASWNLASVFLGGKGSFSKPGTWGGLDAEIQADFDVANAATGRLNSGSGSNDQKIVITDKNKFTNVVWYKVTANCVDGNGNTLATIETDPRIENDGTSQDF